SAGLGWRSPDPGLRGTLPRPADARQWASCRVDRGYCLPARSAALIAPARSQKRSRMDRKR
ncbi:hypothetical protein, partial [Paramuribaculum intestinale]|uniref:hypothetical protein n=1 Tax=Paramuribaculum intestinale TaxID=2094151 RepID=UPI0025A5A262